MKKLLIIFIVCSSLSCHDKAEKNIDQIKIEQNLDIFPINSFLAEQVHMVDSLRLPVLKYSTINSSTDSTLISIEEFKVLANEFMQPDIAHPSLSRFYKETGFADQSIPNITLTYSTSDKSLEVQRMDVIINPNPVLNDKVNSIYMEKITKRKDTSLQKKLYWKTNKQFQITTFIQLPNKPASVNRLKVVWGSYY